MPVKMAPSRVPKQQPPLPEIFLSTQNLNHSLHHLSSVPPSQKFNFQLPLTELIRTEEKTAQAAGKAQEWPTMRFQALVLNFPHQVTPFLSKYLCDPFLIN